MGNAKNDSATISATNADSLSATTHAGGFDSPRLHQIINRSVLVLGGFVSEIPNFSECSQHLYSKYSETYPHKWTVIHSFGIFSATFSATNIDYSV